MNSPAKFLRATILLVSFTLIPNICYSQQGYKHPPKEVLDILNAPVTPTAIISPTRDNVLLATSLRYPPLADLSQPMLRLAGKRINPASNAPHRLQYSVRLTLKRIYDGTEIKIDLPTGAKVSSIDWSEDGKHFSFLNTTANRVELWVGDAVNGKVHTFKSFAVNSAYGDPVTWMPDGRTLLVNIVPTRPGAPPTPQVPNEPNTQESSGRPGPVVTYEDLL